MPHDVRQKLAPKPSENMSELFAEEYHNGTLRLEDLWVWLDMSTRASNEAREELRAPPAGDV